MYVIGLTGGLGTGKSTVAGMFKGLGAKVLDADQIARDLILPGGACFAPVVKMLGREILDDGMIDRGRVAARVFRDPDLRMRLERIIHPHVRRIMTRKIHEFRNKGRVEVVVLDVPLLFESKMDRNVDLTLVVLADRTTQVARAAQCLGITKAEALRRIRAQMPMRNKIRMADLIIDNRGTIKQTQKQVKQVWKKLW